MLKPHPHTYRIPSTAIPTAVQSSRTTEPNQNSHKIITHHTHPTTVSFRIVRHKETEKQTVFR